MKNSCARFILFSILVTCSVFVAAQGLAQTAFEESGGLVVMEVESAPVSGDWQCRTAMSGYTGSCYYWWDGPDLFNAPGSGVLTYRIKINDPGKYNLRIRNRHDQPDSTENNDVFVRMDGGPWVKAYSSQRGQWTWRTNHEFSHDNKPPAEYSNLSAGIHTLEISGRSNGFSIDRIHLYKDSVANPLDETLAESNQVSIGGGGGAAMVTGELKKWHKVTVTFDGPWASESDPSTFLNHRLDVTFTHIASGATYVVPGFFAADGNAAESSATSGTKWRVHFTPDRTGDWTYEASFVTGNEVAVSGQTGTPTGFDGESGAFIVANTDKSGADHRAKGMLHYVGSRYLQYANGEYFIKGGADAPETFLAYGEFDQTDNDHQYAPHVPHWNQGDPTWQGGKGKGIIGALNYLASKGMNAQSFLPMNVEGDGDNVWPWTAKTARRTYDISKLAQWEVVFEHADHKGFFLHFKTQETENDQLLDGGDLGVERKLYYRELVARFGHHHALNWNLGEEFDVWAEKNDADQWRLKAYATYIRDLDPYDHPIVAHTYPGDHDAVYTDLLGYADIEGPSLQLATMAGGYEAVRKWVLASESTGHPWNVSIDEPGDAAVGISTDAPDANFNHVEAREVLWGALMAGGDGVEWYFGYQEPENDLDCEDFTVRSNVWDFTRYALEFMRNYIPFHNMNVLSGPNADEYVLAQPGVAWAAYLPHGGSFDVDLGSATSTFDVRWFDPRNGGSLQTGSVATLSGGGVQSVGQPPSAPNSDWVVLVALPQATESYTLSVTGGSGSGEYPEGATVTIEAASPAAGKVFDRWTGDTATIADLTSATTTLTMPASDASVEATYRDAPEGDRVVSMTLIDADTNQSIAAYDPMADGVMINLATLGTRDLSIRADTDPSVVGSVRFGLDGSNDHRTESVAPYALEGDVDGDYNSWTPTPGTHTVTATPFSEAGGEGEAGHALTLRFVVVDDPSIDVPPVVTFLAPEDGRRFETTDRIPLTVRAADPDGTAEEVSVAVHTDQHALQGDGELFTGELEALAAGTYMLTATALDDAGNEASASVTIVVEEAGGADTGVGADTGMGADTGVDAGGEGTQQGGGMVRPTDDGCSCASGGPRGSVAASWLFVLGALGCGIGRRKFSSWKRHRGQ